MPRMIDLIRASAVPSNIVQSAAKGSLSIPAHETIEILVYLAQNNPVLGERARLTLAGWDVKDLRAAAGNPKTPEEVLGYLVSPANVRTDVLPALLENPAVSEEWLSKLAESAAQDVAEIMLGSERVSNSTRAMDALSANPHFAQTPAEKAAASAPGNAAEAEDDSTTADAAVEEVLVSAPPVEGSEEPDTVFDEEFNSYLTEHAQEIASEAEKAFQPIGGFHQGLEMPAEEPLAEAAAASSETSAKPRRVVARKEHLSAEEGRGSALQKISKLDVKGRIQLAMKGNKEDRSILVRDGTKVVALAVLESPKVTDSEVEKFATQKNVLEALLRGISMKRRFAKHYGIMRNLVFNPRTPLDVSLGLMKNLLVGDLKNLSGNKEVSETIRKSALRMHRQKKEASK